jgi:hypothetical protein
MKPTGIIKPSAPPSYYDSGSFNGAIFKGGSQYRYRIIKHDSGYDVECTRWYWISWRKITRHETEDKAQARLQELYNYTHTDKPIVIYDTNISGFGSSV